VERVNQQVAATDHDRDTDQQRNEKNRHVTLLWLLSCCRDNRWCHLSSDSSETKNLIKSGNSNETAPERAVAAALELPLNYSVANANVSYDWAVGGVVNATPQHASVVSGIVSIRSVAIAGISVSRSIRIPRAERANG
jgi:hypothetical protein